MAEINIFASWAPEKIFATCPVCGINFTRPASSRTRPPLTCRIALRQPLTLPKSIAVQNHRTSPPAPSRNTLSPPPSHSSYPRPPIARSSQTPPCLLDIRSTCLGTFIAVYIILCHNFSIVIVCCFAYFSEISHSFAINCNPPVFPLLVIFCHRAPQVQARESGCGAAI